jgi:hypothetical protein
MILPRIGAVAVFDSRQYSHILTTRREEQIKALQSYVIIL